MSLWGRCKVNPISVSKRCLQIRPASNFLWSNYSLKKHVFAVADDTQIWRSGWRHPDPIMYPSYMCVSHHQFFQVCKNTHRALVRWATSLSRGWCPTRSLRVCYLITSFYFPSVLTQKCSIGLEKWVKTRLARRFEIILQRRTKVQANFFGLKILVGLKKSSSLNSV